MNAIERNKKHKPMPANYQTTTVRQNINTEYLSKYLNKINLENISIMTNGLKTERNFNSALKQNAVEERCSEKASIFRLKTSLLKPKIKNESNKCTFDESNNFDKKNINNHQFIYKFDENSKLKKIFSFDYLKKLNQDLKKNLKCSVKGKTLDRYLVFSVFV